MKRKLIGSVVMVALCFIFGGVAKADNLHLCDVNTVCNSGSVISVFGTPATVFVNGTSYTGGTLYLLVMTPASGNSGNWNSSNNLWNVLGVNPSQTYPTLASAISQESGATESGRHCADRIHRIGWPKTAHVLAFVLVELNTSDTRRTFSAPGVFLSLLFFQWALNSYRLAISTPTESFVCHRV